MPDFDYGNARLRAMKSRLLSRQSLQALAAVESISGLLNALADTVYREAIEEALVRRSGMPALTEALQNQLAETIGKARHFFSGRVGELAALVVRRYDVQNVKTILRGLTQQVPADQILAGTIPIGELAPADLSELARANNAREAIDLLATWREPLAQPLLRLRAERPGAELFEMELALERWYFEAAMDAAERNGSALREWALLEADVTNILTVLRLIGVEAGPFLRQHFDTEAPWPLLIGPGRVSFDLLVEAADQASVQAAVATLAETPYAETLADALAEYESTGRLSVFERALAGRKLNHASQFFIRDPHGIGIFIGYVALKTNEVANLRGIAQGVQIGQTAEDIRGGLM